MVQGTKPESCLPVLWTIGICPRRAVQSGVCSAPGTCRDGISFGKRLPRIGNFRRPYAARGGRGRPACPGLLVRGVGREPLLFFRGRRPALESGTLDKRCTISVLRRRPPAAKKK